MQVPSAELSESTIYDAITFLASHIAIEKQNGRLPQEPTLDITFMLPGKHEKPSFDGMRMGGYTHDKKTLYFETAVPEHITRSEKAHYYVTVVLQDMIDSADIFFTESDVKFNASFWHSALHKITNLKQRNTQH
jgi:hypothetical protein